MVCVNHGLIMSFDEFINYRAGDIRFWLAAANVCANISGIYNMFLVH